MSEAEKTSRFWDFLGLQNDKINEKDKKVEDLLGLAAFLRPALEMKGLGGGDPWDVLFLLN